MPDDLLAERLRSLGIPPDYGRRRGLRRVREPRALSPIGTDTHGREQRLVPRAASAFQRMRRAAAQSDIALHPVSAFRSIDYQCTIIERKLDRGQHLDAILAVSAAPGYSEHHTGRAVDLTTPGYAALEQEFEQSAAFAWLTRHAERYGFALSFPRGNRHGMAYEPWHWCWHRRRGAAAPWRSAVAAST